MPFPKKILLVDDDGTSLFITRRVLKKAKVAAEVLNAKHGEEALNIVKEVCQWEQCPDLILLDINMPVIDGFAFLEELQKSADLINAPLKIVSLSTSTNCLDLSKARQFPVIDCIEKPLTLEKLARFL